MASISGPQRDFRFAYFLSGARAAFWPRSLRSRRREHPDMQSKSWPIIPLRIGDSMGASSRGFPMKALRQAWMGNPRAGFRFPLLGHVLRNGRRLPGRISPGDFREQASLIRVRDPGENSVLDFTNGDAITLEAWINPASIAEDQQIYIVGKGRTNNKGVPKENQNYALRLRGVGGTARISFLFRNHKNRNGVRDDYHRWNSDIGFVPASGWHHVAVTYEFGNPNSIKGYLDGRLVSGTWDYGGQTVEAPVVDNDELWIGSSLGGNKSSTFQGDLDEIAIFRTALSPKQIAKRFYERPIETFLATRELPKDAVLVEILEGIPDQKSWNYPPAPRLIPTSRRRLRSWKSRRNIPTGAYRPTAPILSL